MGGRFCEIVWVCGWWRAEGVGGRCRGEVGRCAGEEGCDWIGHFFSSLVFLFSGLLCVCVCVYVCVCLWMCGCGLSLFFVFLLRTLL